MSSAHDRVIVITSINPPTEAVRLFAGRADSKTLVVGDRKSPADWSSPGVEYLGPDDAWARGNELYDSLPFNHYSRKMLGYLKAAAGGANVIVDTDDDNLPKPDWSFPDFDGEFETTPDALGFVNVYASFTDQFIWPRGLPLQHVINPSARIVEDSLAEMAQRVGVWQGLADGDPDVDAIYRLTRNELCTFKDRPPVVLGEGTWSPFNSQNTATRAEFFPLLYLPAHVTFRFTDILRGLVAQPILWVTGHRLGFTAATVVQERNPHDYMSDFRSEIPCYLDVDRVARIVGEVVRPAKSVADNLHSAYVALRDHEIVPDSEIRVLEAWLTDLSRIYSA